MQGQTAQVRLPGDRHPCRCHPDRACLVGPGVGGDQHLRRAEGAAHGRVQPGREVGDEGVGRGGPDHRDPEREAVVVGGAGNGDRGEIEEIDEIGEAREARLDADRVGRDPRRRSAET